MNVQHLDAFRKNVLATMAAKNISLRTMAGALGTSHTYLHRMLGGELSPSLERCEQIAKYLRIPLPELIQKKCRIPA